MTETMTLEEYRRLHGKRAPHVKPRPGIKLPREEDSDIGWKAFDEAAEAFRARGWWFATEPGGEVARREGEMVRAGSRKELLKKLEAHHGME